MYVTMPSGNRFRTTAIRVSPIFLIIYCGYYLPYFSWRLFTGGKNLLLKLSQNSYTCLFLNYVLLYPISNGINAYHMKVIVLYVVQRCFTVKRFCVNDSYTELHVMYDLQ